MDVSVLVFAGVVAVAAVAVLVVWAVRSPERAAAGDSGLQRVGDAPVGSGEAAERAAGATAWMRGGGGGGGI
ncbi:hypothetical protein [Yinghuangia soli]|uniref:Uncharacterized protein n=1 Tax=Yinghuangia soli TaxID=2908204 RepID=A0AA41Q2N5_9ACTN|nr:hypothetical protein [Yinghuangia soli]MCF2530092.1 hypothetical protein [Yinghuangia soli]